MYAIGREGKRLSKPFLQLKKRLRMLADRTDLERFGPFVDMSAVPALPPNRFIFCKEGAGLNLFEEFQVALLKPEPVSLGRAILAIGYRCLNLRITCRGGIALSLR